MIVCRKALACLAFVAALTGCAKNDASSNGETPDANLVNHKAATNYFREERSLAPGLNVIRTTRSKGQVKENYISEYYLKNTTSDVINTVTLMEAYPSSMLNPLGESKFIYSPTRSLVTRQIYSLQPNETRIVLFYYEVIDRGEDEIFWSIENEWNCTNCPPPVIPWPKLLERCPAPVCQPKPNPCSPCGKSPCGKSACSPCSKKAPCQQPTGYCFDRKKEKSKICGSSPKVILPPLQEPKPIACEEGCQSKWMSGSRPVVTHGVTGVLLKLMDLEDGLLWETPVTYKIEVINQGDLSIRDVEIKIEAPQNMQVDAVCSEQQNFPVVDVGAESGPRTYVVKRIPIIEAKGRVELYVHAHALGPNDFRFKVILSSSDLESGTVEETESTNLQ